MSTTTWIDHQLKNYALARYRKFASLSLSQLKTPSTLFCTLPNSFLAFLCRYQDAVVHWIDDRILYHNSQAQAEMTQFFTQHAIAFLQAKNQFLAIADPEKTALATEYIRFMSDFRDVLGGNSSRNRLATGLKTVLADHQTQLEQLVHNLADSNINQAFVFSTPTCGYYSPTLQLQILHASANHLLEPILDLGCGQGELVQFFRDRAQQAVGVDRANVPNQFCLSVDWFDFPFVSGYWGTIVSHMAFSLHFLHHYFRGGRHLEQYTQCYMDVLSALKPRGSFLYTPGLPFIEALLPPDKYQVERFGIAQTINYRTAEHFQKTYGLDVFYACKITAK